MTSSTYRAIITSSTLQMDITTSAKKLVKILQSTINDAHHPEIAITRDDGKAIGWNLLKQLAAAE